MKPRAAPVSLIVGPFARMACARSRFGSSTRPSKVDARIPEARGHRVDADSQRLETAIRVPPVAIWAIYCNCFHSGDEIVFRFRQGLVQEGRENFTVLGTLTRDAPSEPDSRC